MRMGAYLSPSFVVPEAETRLPEPRCGSGTSRVDRSSGPNKIPRFGHFQVGAIRGIGLQFPGKRAANKFQTGSIRAIALLRKIVFSASGILTVRDFIAASPGFLRNSRGSTDNMHRILIAKRRLEGFLGSIFSGASPESC